MRFYKEIPEWSIAVVAILGVGLAWYAAGSGAEKTETERSIQPEFASKTQVEAVEVGLKKEGWLRHTYTVKSSHHKNAWYVAGRVQRDDLNSPIGIWLLAGDKDEGGMVWAVNRTAENHSDYPSGRDASVSTSVADDEVKALYDVLGE